MPKKIKKEKESTLLDEKETETINKIFKNKTPSQRVLICELLKEAEVQRLLHYSAVMSFKERFEKKLFGGKKHAKSKRSRAN